MNWIRCFCCAFCFFSSMPVPANEPLRAADNGCAIAPQVPNVPRGIRTIGPGGSSDDTSRIQDALNHLQPGDALAFLPGIYEIGKHLTVGISGVTLFGTGATLHATNRSDGALVIQGDNVAVYGFTITQDSLGRLGTPWAGGISIYDDRGGGRRRVQGVTIQNNVVNNSSAAGIFLYKASKFTVANNRVYRSWADGIHMTAGSRGGRVIHNAVVQTGDDMIAVVSYAGARGNAPAALRYKNLPDRADELDRNIYIAENDVSDQYWGRGITVVGGSDVTIERNRISRTATGAGIYIARETSYASFGVHNILIAGNAISQVQTNAPTYMPPGFNPSLTHHGAIEILAQMTEDELSDPVFREAFSVSDIALAGNHVQEARFAGITLKSSSAGNPISRVMIDQNSLVKVGSNHVIADYSGYTPLSVSCTDNSLDGEKFASQCDKSVPAISGQYSVSGASLTCSAGEITGADVRLR
ncbi:MAG: right-handed parallel beta-helix repeat-containing protein [Gammaproteobacteria bacterium]